MRVYVYVSGSQLLNSTVVDNGIGYAGSGVHLENGTMNNSIVWFNGSTATSRWASATIGYSCWSNAPATDGNIGGNPRFVARSRGDYRILRSSPCFNRGANYSWTEDDLDLIGNPRILFKECDMGAFECDISSSTVLLVR